MEDSWQRCTTLVNAQGSRAEQHKEGEEEMLIRTSGVMSAMPAITMRIAWCKLDKPRNGRELFWAIYNNDWINITTNTATDSINISIQHTCVAIL